MLCGVLVLGRVTASDVTAGTAQPQMDPVIAHFETFLATASLWLNVVDLVQVGTFAHGLILLR